jgi:hypothetical protein
MLFFDELNRVIIRLYIDACLIDLREYYYKRSSVIISKSNVFVASILNNELSINVWEMTAILLIVQSFEHQWKRCRLEIFTNNITTYIELENQILKESINNSLRKILLLTIKWDIILILNWISINENALIDALSRFDSSKIVNMCSHWQILLTSINSLNSIILSSSTWSHHSTLIIESELFFDTI